MQHHFVQNLDFTHICGNVPTVKQSTCYIVLLGAPRIAREKSREKSREEIKRKEQRKLLDEFGQDTGGGNHLYKADLQLNLERNGLLC